MRHQGGLALVATLVTIALLAVTLVLTPDLAARASVHAQGTAQVERPRFPLYFFLLKPNAQLPQVLSGLRLTEKQSMDLGMLLAQEARLLSVSQARGTFGLDAGPIAQASWVKLENEILAPEQYAALQRWVATQDEFLLGVLRDMTGGSMALATGVPAELTGTPTVPPPVRELLAAVQTAAQGTPGTATNGTPPPAGTQPAATGVATTAATRAATVAATAVPATATPIPATATVAATATPAASPTGAATARPAGTSSAGSITVVGQGRAMATPNVAQLTVGVEVISNTVQLASGEANQKVADIIARLKGLGIADRDIQTAQYSIFPYREPERPIGPATQGPAQPTPRPQYRVDATVRVTVRDLNLVGQAIDGAIAAGANNVGGIQFTVEDPTPAMDQARADAFNDARRRAQQLAQLAGMTLGPPTYITEVIGSAPLARADAALRAAPAAAPMAAPPIEGGELTYTMQLQITFELR